MTGYNELRTHAAWKDLSARGRILVHGEDNARLLHAMTSNHIQALEDGQSAYAFFLNAQGRIQADATILRRAPDFWIDTEAVAGAALFAHLDKFIIADDVTLEDLADTHFEIGIEGPAAASILNLDLAPGEVKQHEDGFAARINETGLDGIRLMFPVARREDWLAKVASIPEASSEAWEIVRHEQGKPRFGVEILEKHLVQETRLMHGVHFTKGCYLGQEIVERVRARGAVHRGLAAISIDTTTPPEVNAEITSGGAKAGTILSAVFSPAEQKTVAFAMLSVDSLSGAKPLVCLGATVALRASSAFAPH